PVITTRIVVNSGPEKVDVVGAEAASRLIVDRLPANTDGFVCPEAVAVLSIVLAVAPVRAVSRLAPARVGSAWHTITVLAIVSIIRRIAVIASRIAALAPHNIERVAFRSTRWVFNLHHSHAAVPRISNQVLAATSIDALEPEVRGVRRHDSG